jgi:hypothetical protein
MSKVRPFTRDGHLRCADGRNDDYRFDWPCKRIATVKVSRVSVVYTFLCDYHFQLYGYDESRVLQRSPRGFKQKCGPGYSYEIVPYDER